MVVLLSALSQPWMQDSEAQSSVLDHSEESLHSWPGDHRWMTTDGSYARSGGDQSGMAQRDFGFAGEGGERGVNGWERGCQLRSAWVHFHSVLSHLQDSCRQAQPLHREAQASFIMYDSVFFLNLETSLGFGSFWSLAAHAPSTQASISINKLLKISLSIVPGGRRPSNNFRLIVGCRGRRKEP